MTVKEKYQRYEETIERLRSCIYQLNSQLEEQKSLNSQLQASIESHIKEAQYKAFKKLNGEVLSRFLQEAVSEMTIVNDTNECYPEIRLSYKDSESKFEKIDSYSDQYSY